MRPAVLDLVSRGLGHGVQLFEEVVDLPFVASDVLPVLVMSAEKARTSQSSSQIRYQCTGR